MLPTVLCPLLRHYAPVLGGSSAVSLFPTALAASVVVGAVVAPSASADQAKQTFVTGLTQAEGTIVDPAGAVWVADAKAGFCRVQQPSGTTPGRIDNP